MTKKFVTRALLTAGLVFAGVTATFAQAPVMSTVRRVPPSQESKQPVPASAVILSSSMQLNADQRAKITSLNQQVAALHSERTRLWSEYRSIVNRPNYDDNMAANEAAPRMHRIVEINNTLAPLVANQDAQLSSILSSTQRAQVAQLMTNAKAQL